MASAYGDTATLAATLTLLRAKHDDTRLRAALTLLDHIREVSRELSSEAFGKYMNDVNRKIFDLMNSGEVADRLGGVAAIDALIDFDGEENSSKVTRFANYLRIVLPGPDAGVMVVASKAVGRLAASGGTLTNDFVEFEVKRALEWLQGDRNEIRRHAAVLVLCALATHAPTLVYAYVPQYLEYLWTAVKDPKQVVREAAADALRACLALLYQRESYQRSSWYARISEEADRCMRAATVEAIHGGLLVYRELLLGTGMFMNSQFIQVCEATIKHKDHKDALVRRTVMHLLPVLAAYNPMDFSHYYLDKSMQHLMIQLRKGDKDVALTSIGDIAVAVKNDMEPYLESILKAVKEGLASKGKVRQQHEKAIYHCISQLARAVGQAITQYSHDLLDLMLAGSLTEALCAALAELSAHVNPLKPVIKERLLNVITLILSGGPYRAPGDPRSRTERSVVDRDRAASSSSSVRDVDLDKDPSTIVLALSTLADFEYSGYMLHEFIRDSVVTYLDNDNADIRRAAANAACEILRRDPVMYQTSKQSLEVVDEVLTRLLSVAISDSDAFIRELVLRHMTKDFDRHLVQAANLKALFLAMNDEVFGVREHAARHVGRLTEYNPAYIIPQLRKIMIQLLTELEFSTISRTKEESAKLLGILIRSSQRFVKAYVEPILKVLITKASEPSSGVAASILYAIGELAEVGCETLVPHLDRIMPIILEALNDLGSQIKREAALITLGQLCSNTGFVIEPYLKYPTLMPTLIRIMKSEQNPRLRTETLRVIGIIGALDPFRMVRTVDSDDQKVESDGFQQQPISPGSDEYLPSVAIGSLVKILKDPSLSTYHTPAIQAFMYIFKTLGMRCVPFLPQIIPTFLSVMRQAPAPMLEFHFQQLSTLVSIVRHNIRNYLKDIFALVAEFWNPNSSLQVTILTLVESIALVMNNEFKPYLPQLLTKMLFICEVDAGEKRPSAQKVLQTLVVFGNNLQDYLHLVVPSLCRLMEKSDAPLAVRRAAVQTIGRMARRLDFTDYTSRIVHSIVRILTGSQVDLRLAALDTLCMLVIQVGEQFLMFSEVINRALEKQRISHPKYASLMRSLQAGDALPQISQLFGEDRLDEAKADDAPMVDVGGIKKLPVGQLHLKRAWETAQRTTKEDWIEWMRRFSVELLKESPSHALRACASLASIYHPLAKELFNAAFVSCWTELYDQHQDELVQSIDTALKSPNIPPEILNTLLNLSEFMEHDDKTLPIDPRSLGSYASKCHAYAKALHYREAEFIINPTPILVEALISVNNQLQQPDTAVGTLTYAQQHLNLDLKESWYEKLQRWEDALAAYERKQMEDPNSFETTLGRMRCLHELCEWDALSQLSKSKWETADEDQRRAMSSLAASAAWGMNQWEHMDNYVAYMKEPSPNRLFFRAVHLIQRNDFLPATKLIEQTRRLLDTELTALVSESYSRAYNVIVRIQMLAEMEEIIAYKFAEKEPEKRATIKRTWMKRLQGCQRTVEVWQRILKLRSAVIAPSEDLDMYIRFANLCRKSNRLALSERTIANLIGVEQLDEVGKLPVNVQPQVTFAYLKHVWATGAREEALQQLKEFNARLAVTVKGSQKGSERHDELSQLASRTYLKQGKWLSVLNEEWNDENISDVLRANSAATQYDPNFYKAWHAWSLSNFEIISYYEKTQEFIPTQALSAYVVPAVKGFFRSLALSRGNSLQDTLRLLTLWFKFGYQQEVNSAISEGLSSVSVDTWLQVIPQLIARIYAPSPSVRKLVQQLLSDIGRQHPQALVYSLTVAMKSHTASRRQAAISILDKMRVLRPQLVDQALMVSQELIRVSILWQEMWHEGLEEASRFYFGDGNIEGMLTLLEPLHQMMERASASFRGPETMREVSFNQAFGRDLQEAREWCEKYKQDMNTENLNQAWDLYYQVFRKITKQLGQMTSLELSYVSPKLLGAKDMEIAVPGTYASGKPIVTIASFKTTLNVISSKQRPRKLAIKGSDGKEYNYLLKGHEDLRQDERVMQLFGLVNTLLRADPETFKRHLRITRFAVIPLSINSGLIGWVQHCDTLHALIKEYRDAKKIILNIEHRLMLQMAPDYENLALLQKVEVFEYAQENTNGQDLYNILWLKSKNSETWLERRTNYTRSLAVMSMVGYVLGLGDRHPSNLMLNQLDGTVVHIDFGDCFEVAMHREKFPEKIPFRLTRMLVNAMEVCGIEGSYRKTCEIVMRVLRDNKESLMAVLEAFVYDPLINWKLARKDRARAKLPDATGLDGEFDGMKYSQTHRRTSRHDIPSQAEEENRQPEMLNQRAVEIINRIQNKLTGRDFKPTVTLDVTTQVDKLIREARSVENLCQCYIGWCAFW